MPVISGLKTDAITIGKSNTDTNNFQLRSNADGTATLARKSDGSGGDVLTIDGSGNVALPSNTSNKLVSASGSAPVYACRAWCTFNGTTTGTNAPIAGGNVTSVTRNSAGDYTINFTTSMPNATFVVTGTVTNSAVSNPCILITKAGTPKTVSSVNVITTYYNYVPADYPVVDVAIFG